MLLLVAKMYSRPLRVVSSMVTIKINPKNWHKDKIKMRAVGQIRILQERRGLVFSSNDHKRDDEMALEYGRQIGLDVVTRVLL